jgi:phosphomannomutase/phosphoglucomutase
MTDNIFREYDIRGIVRREIELDKVRDLGKAILTYFLQQKPDLSRIIIGMDGRVHSPFLKNELVTAANEMGISVTDIGLCPTPVFYFSLFTTEITSGLIVTASHNPKNYNGIKICLEKQSVWGEQIQEIKSIFYRRWNHSTNKNFLKTNKKTTKNSSYDAISDYLNWLTDHFSSLKNKDINAVIDCGNGTAGTIFPRLVDMMGWKNIKLLYEEVDGKFPNHEADPTTIKNMRTVQEILTQENLYDIGLGLDGDSDRMNPMTKSGYLVPGDKLLALYSKKIVAHYKNPSIVFDIKSSDALIQELKTIGAKPCIAPSGHSIIKEHLKKHNAKLAGELSCHFFFNDRYFGYDDGIYAALRLFELLDESDETLDQMLKNLPTRTSSPEYRITCDENKKKEVVDHVKNIFAARKDTQLLTIDGVRATMPYGWGLLRASNTQAVICLRFESDSATGVKQVEKDFLSALSPYFDKKLLKEHFEG